MTIGGVVMLPGVAGNAFGADTTGTAFGPGGVDTTGAGGAGGPEGALATGGRAGGAEGADGAEPEKGATVVEEVGLGCCGAVGRGVAIGGVVTERGAEIGVGVGRGLEYAAA